MIDLVSAGWRHVFFIIAQRRQLSNVGQPCSENKSDDIISGISLRKYFIFLLILYIMIKRRDVAQLGRALGSGPRGRRFKSSHSDHFISNQVASSF